MAKTFLTPLDLTRNELQNARLQNLAAAPGSPVGGLMYFDTTLGCARIYSGAAWVNADATKSAAGSLAIALLTVDPTQRANHSGTQVAATISNLQTVVQAYSLSAFAAPTANIALAGFKFTGAGTPVAAGDVAEYSWVIGQLQNAAAGISSKTPVRAVSQVNVATLSGTQTIDTVTLAVGDRVLLVAQTTATQNGPWLVSAGAWSRPVTEGSTGELDQGATWLAINGGAAGSLWRMATTGAIVPGTTSISIVQFSAGQSYTAGQGLTGTNTFSVQVIASGGITVSAGGIAVDTAIVTRKFAATIGDGAATSYNVPHNLGTRDAMVQVYQATAPFGTVEVDINRTDTNNVAVVFSVAPAAGAYRVVVQA